MLFSPLFPHIMHKTNITVKRPTILDNKNVSAEISYRDLVCLSFSTESCLVSSVFLNIVVPFKLHQVNSCQHFHYKFPHSGASYTAIKIRLLKIGTCSWSKRINFSLLLFCQEGRFLSFYILLLKFYSVLAKNEGKRVSSLVVYLCMFCLYRKNTLRNGNVHLGKFLSISVFPKWLYISQNSSL